MYERACEVNIGKSSRNLPHKGDADTLIVSTTLEYATNTKDVTVIADNTDVFVLFMYHWGYQLRDIFQNGSKEERCFKDMENSRCC